MGMVGVDKIGEIRRAYFEQERSIKEIVRTLSVSRATVRKVIRGHQTEFKYAPAFSQRRSSASGSRR
jgi:IS30 family transposase